ncbi:unnamed protein product [Boreogadus saida]
MPESDLDDLVTELVSGNDLAGPEYVRAALRARGLRALYNEEGWRMVIHGGIDGYSRLVVFLCDSSNNRSSTVLESFVNAVDRYGVPSRGVSSSREEVHLPCSTFLEELLLALPLLMLLALPLLMLLVLPLLMLLTLHPLMLLALHLLMLLALPLLMLLALPLLMLLALHPLMLLALHPLMLLVLPLQLLLPLLLLQLMKKLHG